VCASLVGCWLVHDVLRDRDVFMLYREASPKDLDLFCNQGAKYFLFYTLLFNKAFCLLELSCISLHFSELRWELCNKCGSIL
jgi:hypothetical protein